ncbi:MAG: WbqC-like family protein [Nitrospirae bacterium]|nr:MAG: WbqC-like family protein [Nitrospirota bacterium]
MERKTIGIVQPSYIPWLPFFERMVYSDVFIILDDVQYSKNSFFNRNALKGFDGRILLTVPVLYRGQSTALINEILVNWKVNWNIKHFKTLKQYYAKAPYFKLYQDEIECLYQNQSEKLIEVLIPLINFLKREFRIETPCYLSSEISIQGSKNEKLVNLCKYFGGTHFIVKPGTETYHPPDEFIPHGINFYFLSYTIFEYSQRHGPFEPYLSALDYVLNCGPCDLKSVFEHHRKEQVKYGQH